VEEAKETESSMLCPLWLEKGECSAAGGTDVVQRAWSLHDATPLLDDARSWRRVGNKDSALPFPFHSPSMGRRPADSMRNPMAHWLLSR